MYIFNKIKNQTKLIPKTIEPLILLIINLFTKQSLNNSLITVYMLLRVI